MGLLGTCLQSLNWYLYLLPKKPTEFTMVPSQICSSAFITYPGKWKIYLPTCPSQNSSHPRLLTTIIKFFLFYLLRFLNLGLSLHSTTAFIQVCLTVSQLTPLALDRLSSNYLPYDPRKLALQCKSDPATLIKTLWVLPPLPGSLSYNSDCWALLTTQSCHEQKLLTCTPDVYIYITYTSIPVLDYYRMYTKIET